jgi:hypothetical protein
MTDYFLAKGSHASPEEGLCAMEWVSFIAGERHTDEPECVSPILRSFCISLNDALDDAMRQRLRPYLARCIGTAGDGMDRERGFLCLDWQIRTYLPAWLRLAGLAEDANRISALAPIVDLDTARAAAAPVRASRERARAAGAAAGDAARAAAWAAARAAAGDAAWAAAWDAARAAARAAAGDAAWDAARDAARAAAGAAARAALQPTVRELQESALDLLDRMLPKVMVPMPAPVLERATAVCGA